MFKQENMQTVHHECECGENEVAAKENGKHMGVTLDQTREGKHTAESN